MALFVFFPLFFLAFLLAASVALSFIFLLLIRHAVHRSLRSNSFTCTPLNSAARPISQFEMPWPPVRVGLAGSKALRLVRFLRLGCGICRLPSGRFPRLLLLMCCSRKDAFGAGVDVMGEAYMPSLRLVGAL